MRKLHLFLVFTGTVLLAVSILQCESPQKAKRENPDAAGGVGSWNPDMQENASEMLQKEKRFTMLSDGLLNGLNKIVADAKQRAFYFRLLR
jgi:hypothetical protein